jgi:hypothetical protein
VVLIRLKTILLICRWIVKNVNQNSTGTPCLFCNALFVVLFNGVFIICLNSLIITVLYDLSVLFVDLIYYHGVTIYYSITKHYGGRCGRDRMIVGFTTTYTNLNQTLVEWSLDGPLPNCVRWSRLPTKMAAKLNIEKRGDEILIVHCCFSVSIFSNSSHPEWRAGLSDTLLRGTHLGTIPARFGLIWFSGFRGEDLNVIFYQNMPNLHNRYICCFSISQNELKF